MNTRSILVATGASLVGASALWSVIAAPLSANLVISVLAECASYWLALFALLSGGWLLFRNQQRPVAPVAVLWRCSCIALALAVIGTSWWWSDDQFFFWKMRAIPSAEWPQMVTDLEAFGEQVAQSGGNFLPTTKPPPKSLQRLGLEVDYKGGVANVWETPGYSGVFAVMTFGYKTRSWGLLVGPEERARIYCPRGTYRRVSTNAFFFVGPRG